MEDILELYSSNILDVDLMAEASRSFGKQADDPINKNIDKIYNNKGLNIRGVDQFFRRSYATGDEVFKACLYIEYSLLKSPKAAFKILTWKTPPTISATEDSCLFVRLSN